MKPEILNTVLDGYKILAELGSGSSGIVYQAENLISRQIVALKILSAQTDLAQRELAALRLFQTIEHPNLIRIHHIGQTGDQVFYTMDRCECSLAQRKVSSEELVDIAKKLAGALAELHKHGLIHRDIKPDNILFRNGEIVLGDIGLITRGEHATFAGSPGFMVPGQSIPNEYSDCYALAKSLYCALTGEKPDNFPFYPGTLSPSAAVIMRATLAVCSSTPKIRTASELLQFLNGRETIVPRHGFKFWTILTTAFLILLLSVLGAFIRFRTKKQSVFSFLNANQMGKKSDKPAVRGSIITDTGAVKQTVTAKHLTSEKEQPAKKVPAEPKIIQTKKTDHAPKIQRIIPRIQQIRKRETVVRREKTEITERRAWNERNRILIAKCTSPVQQANLEFEIEWNNLRINLLERSADRKITDAEFNREDRNLVNLWKTAKWILKSGISAETVDRDYGELKEKLTIPDIGLHQQWVQADLDWQSHKPECIKELVRETKESGQNPRMILLEMAKKDPALRFFGIEQANFLDEYEEVRFSGQLDAKQEADKALAKYIQAREFFLKNRVITPKPAVDR